MKKGFWGFGALGFMLTVFLLAAVPAWAQSVDDKIKALEQELSSLKTQQVELKKEATAAAAALPSFSYRPGNGVNIEAADKSWGIRFGIEAHLRAIFEAGSHFGSSCRGRHRRPDGLESDCRALLRTAANRFIAGRRTQSGRRGRDAGRTGSGAGPDRCDSETRGLGGLSPCPRGPSGVVPALRKNVRREELV